MQNYVLGFGFDADRRHLVLIRKETPAWQKGRLNGLGGKVLLGERPIEAMVREFREECAVHTPLHGWRQYARLNGPGYAVTVFTLAHDGILHARTTGAERVILVSGVDYRRFHDEGVAGLAWLVAAAHEAHDRGIRFSAYEDFEQTAIAV